MGCGYQKIKNMIRFGRGLIKMVETKIDGILLWGVIMSELEKILHILSHFVEHTEEHAQEFIELSQRAEKEEEGKALAKAVREASMKLKEAVEILKPYLKNSKNHAS